MRDALKGKSLSERINWAAGRLILSIGEGRFKDELSLTIQVLESNAVARAEESADSRRRKKSA